MTYAEKIQELIAHNFTRVERDDRLLDVFVVETREKGIELWENWTKDTVEIIRFHLPYSPQREQSFTLSRSEVEKMLYENTKVELES